MTTTNYKPHPAADLFPMMPDDQYQAFKEDIRKNGFQQDVVLYKGQILDGRNRYRAAVELNMLDELPIAEMDDDTEIDPFQWVISRNLHRRHLNESQRSLIAGKLAKAKEGRPAKKTVSIDSVSSPTLKQAAEQLQVGRSSVSRAKTVLDHGSPELIASVERGEVAVSKAANIAMQTMKEEGGKSDQWSPDERERQQQVKKGIAVIANAERDKNLIAWAESEGLAERVDRQSKIFGNPFLLDKDGDRDFVCDAYEKAYLPLKPWVRKNVSKLFGKVLICHCYPLRCHGEALLRLMQEDNQPCD